MNSAHGVRALLVSAIGSGQGKTSATAALARRLGSLGLRVSVFKAGPDFIDPLVLERASGAPVQALDLWMCGIDDCRRRLARAAEVSDIVLVEGMMGLYDGTPSSADLARALDLPVLLVLDISAMAQTAGALVLGLRDYGPIHVAGVLANRAAGSGHARMVADALPDVPLLATLTARAVSLPERQLGLTLPDEVAAIDSVLRDLAAGLDLDMPAWAALPRWQAPTDASRDVPASPLQGRTVAIARDAAFAFLYPANLDCLRELGAQPVFFSPLADQPVPPQADAVWLPGGYPELHAAALSLAGNWQVSLRTAHARGLPIVAECGGMMALADGLTDAAGRRWPMAGILSGEVHMQQRVAAIGPQALATADGELRGHAFHYSRLASPLVPAGHATRHPGGQRGEPVYRVGSLHASYFHGYFPSCPNAVARLFQGSGQ